MSLASLTSMTLETKVQEHSFKSAARLGVHYFANTSHYHAADLQLWLPKLTKLGVNWIVLPAPADRAIPEEFILSLITAGIQPILHLSLPLEKSPNFAELTPLFEAYANWGVKYVALFDRPNLRVQWPATGWTQRGLVERFLEIFLPVARAAVDAGLTPVFPPLEPGGDYWDTAFLRSALESLQERGETDLLDKLTLGAYAWAGDNPIIWGAGGPERWPATLPYSTPDGSQDQRGFHIFDWYNAISSAAIGRELPILILAAGVQRESSKAWDAQEATRAIKMAEAVQLDPKNRALDSVPANVLACNFWLLASGNENEVGSAWFQTSGKPSRIGKEWIDWLTGERPKGLDEVDGIDSMEKSDSAMGEIAHSVPSIPFMLEGLRAIRHYLLLPSAEDWPLESIKPFVMQHQPTIGYSVDEAKRAARVTLAGGLQSFSDELIRDLIQAGCQVENLPTNA